ncbi:hypothetical protein [Psychrobacillus sp. L4]|uniref:hypothetical protein n=1 Tax=Psychrobacillus sp. L4 TaxID=3236892 RepID=UPI0036F1FC32
MDTKFKDFKLIMDLKPGAYHGSGIRKKISQSLWKKIRGVVLEVNNNSCKICGYQPSVEKLRQLHAHEVEEYATDELLCILKDIDLLCIKCHSWQHLGRTFSRLNNEQLNDLKVHFMLVNNCSEEEYKEYFKEFKIKKREATLKEIEDEAKVVALNMKLDNLVLYRVEGEIPYKEEVIKHLANKGLYKYYGDEN